MIKKHIFIDTSAWYALADAGDVNHARSKIFLPNALADYRDLITTNHVVGETYTLLLYRLGHAVALGFISNIRKSLRLKNVFVSWETEMKAYTLLQRYPDQSFSFIDGTSFAVMKEQGISDCFAFDKHFAIAGFNTFPVLN